MTDEDDSKRVDLSAYVDVTAAMIALPIPAFSKPIVIANLETAMRMADLLDGFDLDEREEPAPVFRP